MEEASTPVADLKREQSEPSAIGQNGLDAAASEAVNRSTPALNEGSLSHVQFSTSDHANIRQYQYPNLPNRLPEQILQLSKRALPFQPTL